VSDVQLTAKPAVLALKEWAPNDAIERGRELASLLGEERDGRYPDMHAGLAALFEALESRCQQIIFDELGTIVTNEGAVYTGKLGEIRGLRSVGGIAKGIVTNARNKEDSLRRQEEED
jgi:hypothetical protein